VVYQIKPGRWLIKNRLECGGYIGDYIRQDIPNDYICITAETFSRKNYVEEPEIKLETDGTLHYSRGEIFNTTLKVPDPQKVHSTEKGKCSFLYELLDQKEQA
jgi:hypothetical protein